MYLINSDRELIKEFINKVINWKKKRGCLFWPYARDSEGRAKKRNILVARIVCKAVYGKAPKLKPLALHTCGNGHLGCINPHHLYWGNHKDNKLDSIEHGTQVRGERQGRSKLLENEIKEIRYKYSIGETQCNLGKEYGVDRSTISMIVRRKTWKHI